jgi:DNA-binding NtrC family response regulator
MARILLAEADARIRGLIAGILADFGHSVTACDNCIEATALLAIRAIDVLLTDLVLREAEGSELSRRCASNGIPTITLTGWKFHAGQAEQDLPPPLLDKPFRFDDLQRVLDAVAGHSRPPQALQPVPRKAA